MAIELRELLIADYDVVEVVHDGSALIEAAPRAIPRSGSSSQGGFSGPSIRTFHISPSVMSPMQAFVWTP